MSKTIQIIGLVLIGGLLVWLLVSLVGGDGMDGDTPATSTDDATFDFTNDWEEYDSAVQPLSFQHPPEAAVTSEAGMVKVQFLGDDNTPASEVTDGLTGYFTVQEIAEVGDLGGVAEEVFSERSETSQEIVTEVESGTWAGKTGFTFQLRNQLGNVTDYHVVPADDDRALVVSYTAVGPEAETYVDTFADITRTIAFSGAESDSATDTDDQVDADDTDTDDSVSRAESCSAAGGTWLAEHQECEYISAEWCADQGGEFSECASACRHDPNAEICTMQCVQVCSFSS